VSKSLLIVADGGCHTGFSQVTHQIGERLATEHGWDVSVLAANFRGDHWQTPLRLYRANRDQEHDVTGMSRIIDLMAQVMPDAVVFIQDPKVVLNFLAANPWDKEHVLVRGIGASNGLVYKPPILAYLAVDGYENPRSWDALRDMGVTRIAMSEHGRAAMPEAPVIWHGVDTAIYHPQDRSEAKRALGFSPDRFLVLRVDKNSWRKDYPSSWKALRPLLRAHPDVDVHFHCRPNAADGYDLDGVRWNDEDIRDRVTFTPNLGGYTGLPQEKMATLYAAADLFLSTSWGEGWGLTLTESMACGTPVLAQDCSAITEVVGPGGILVKPRGRITVPMGQEQCLPDVEKFSYWLEHLYSSRKMREALGVAAVAQASRFSWDEAAVRMNNAITREVEKAAH
jgi:glycosyltransferase involved in cell wall biosynthesis